jgi:hypothetical protein
MRTKYNDDRDTPQKMECRNRLADYCRSVRQGGHVLSLTSTQPRCITKLRSEGIISRDNNFTGVESEPSKIAAVERKLRGFDFRNCYLHTDNLATLDMASLTDLQGGIDLGFFDLCGRLSDEQIKWFEALPDFCNHDARLAITVCNARRAETGAGLLGLMKEHTKLRDFLYGTSKLGPDNFSWPDYRKKPYENAEPVACLLEYCLGPSVRIDHVVSYKGFNGMLFILATKVGSTRDYPTRPSIFSPEMDAEFGTRQFMSDLTLHTDGIWIPRVQASSKHPCSLILKKFSSAQTSNELAGAYRAATCYVRKAAKKGGRPKRLYEAGLKAYLSKYGYSWQGSSSNIQGDRSGKNRKRAVASDNRL